MMARPRTASDTPTPLNGGTRAKQRAALILAVLSGDCPLGDASRRMGVSTQHYYGLERRALQGMVYALDEPKERRRIAALDRQHVHLEQEVLRLQALVRATQRAAGVPPAPKSDKRRRKVPPRACKMIARLQSSEASALTTEE